jgi:plasmid maintenance system antidote protein VapI
VKVDKNFQVTFGWLALDAIALWIAEADLNKTALAAALGISRNSLYMLVTQKQAVLGPSAELWLNLQATHDLWRARAAIDVSKMRRIAA